MTAPYDERSFASDPGVPDLSVGYRTGGFEDVEDIAGLAQSVYGGDVQKWRGSMSRALSRQNNLLVLANCRGVLVGYGGSGVLMRADPPEANANQK